MTACEDGQDAPQPARLLPFDRGNDRDNEHDNNSSAGCKTLTSP
jgi:hypothetical protein